MTRSGYADLVAWASQFGVLDRFGVEGYVAGYVGGITDVGRRIGPASTNP